MAEPRLHVTAARYEEILAAAARAGYFQKSASRGYWVLKPKMAR